MSEPLSHDKRQRIDKLLKRLVEDCIEENRIVSANTIGEILDSMSVPSSIEQKPGEDEDDFILRLARECSFGHDMMKAMIFTRWKDGIDIDVVMGPMKEFVRRLRAMPSASGANLKAEADRLAKNIVNSSDAQCFRWLLKHHSGIDRKRCFIGGVDFAGSDVREAIIDAIDREERDASTDIHGAGQKP